MKSDTRKIINSMLALAMTTAVFTGCSRKVDDVELPSKPEVVTSDTSEPSNSEPPVTTSEPPITTSEPITSEPVTSELITSEPVTPDPEDPYVPEPEPEPAAEPTTSDPNCPPGFVVRQTSTGPLYYDPNEPGYSGGVGRFQFVGELDQDGEHVWGFQGRAPGNCGSEVIPYYVFQKGDYIINFDGIEMPVPDDLVGAADCSAIRSGIFSAYNHAHPEYNTAGNGTNEDVDKIFGW